MRGTGALVIGSHERAVGGTAGSVGEPAHLRTKGDPQDWARGGEVLRAVSVDTDIGKIPVRAVVNPDSKPYLVEHRT